MNIHYRQPKWAEWESIGGTSFDAKISGMRVAFIRTENGRHELQWNLSTIVKWQDIIHLKVGEALADNTQSSETKSIYSTTTDLSPFTLRTRVRHILYNQPCGREVLCNYICTSQLCMDIGSMLKIKPSDFLLTVTSWSTSQRLGTLVPILHSA
jgi:hypothetical protein